MPVNNVLVEALMDRLVREVSKRVDYAVVNRVSRMITIRVSDYETFNIIVKILDKAGVIRNG